MPTPSQAQPPAPPEPMYPAIETFIERAAPADIEQLFAPVKEGLAALKGPKAEQSKKVQAAIQRTEELLNHLIDVREQLIADQKGPAKGRK